MIDPKNFESKIGFDEIRSQLKAGCLSTLGKSLVDELAFVTDVSQVNTWMEEIREMRRIGDEGEDFPLSYFFDVRESVKRVRLEGTWMEEQELFDLRRSLKTIEELVSFLYRGENLDDIPRWDYPALHDLADGIATFPTLIQQIDQIIDKFGHIRDKVTMPLGYRARLQTTAQGYRLRFSGYPRLDARHLQLQTLTDPVAVAPASTSVDEDSA